MDVDGSWIYLDMAGVSIHPFPAGSTGRVGAENVGAGVRVNVKVNMSVTIEANMSSESERVTECEGKCVGKCG